MNIEQVQEEIIEEFSVLEGDRESTVFYIMELGQRLPPMPEAEKNDGNTIKGCMSKVWLTTKMDGSRLFFTADSNTEITKGLISLLVRVLSGRAPEEIAQADLFFIDRIGMKHIIGSQRSNGFASMIKQMKLYALAYSAAQ